MKRPHMTVPTFLMAFLAAALVAFSCLMCLVDAFHMTSNPVILLAWCCFAAAVSAAAMWFRRTGVIAAVSAAVLLALILWFHAPLLESFQGILYAISDQYSLAYPTFPAGGKEGADPTASLMLLAIPLAWLTAWVTGREGSALLVLLACMPVLILCLIIVDIAPVLWLILLTGVLLLLLLSQSVRERNPAEGSRLAWWLVLPTVILVAGITVLWPPAAYERASWSDTLQTLAEAKVSIQAMEATVFSSAGIPKWSASLQEIDLSQLGPRVTTGKTVLQYRSSSAVSYLRGVSLGVYEDNAWSAIPQREFTRQRFEESPLLSAGDAAERLELKTNGQEPMLYTAYFLASIPSGSEAVDDAYISNSEQLYFYQTSYGGGSQTSEAYDAYVLAHYTQVPEELLPDLLEIAEQAGLTTASSPQEVASYVRASGTYDRDTPRIPSGEDFVLYFLQQSHRGYCVHFASAAVMLLRALDIPARYVTGYAVSGQQDVWNTVTDESAHAWVEYYVAGTGWLPLDPTPAEDGVNPAQSSGQTTGQNPTAATPDGTTVHGPNASVLPSEPLNSPDTPDTPDTPANGAEDAPVQENEPATGGEDASASLVATRSYKWLWLLSIPALAGLTVLRRWLALRHRRDLCSRGHPNRRALTLWRWLVRLSKADNAPLPEALLALAEKARFSQHTLSDSELAQLQEALENQIHSLQTTSPTAKRLWYQYGLALF